MSKAIISNRIYLNVTPQLKKELIARLTYKIEKARTGKVKIKMFEIIRNYSVISDTVMSIPQQRMDLIPEGYEIIDKRITNEMPFPDPVFSLRPDQEDVVGDIEDSAIINALVGWGKTFAALHLARRLGQKTLVILHNTFLRDQWVKEIENLYRMPVGVIGSGEYDIDHAIVVGNVQSVVKYTKELSKEFGTIILDEMHHVAASTFSDIIDSSHARYRIGLSGTLNRTDGKHVIFKDYFGIDIHQPPQANTLNPTILTLNTGIQLQPGVSWAEKLNILLYDKDYQEFIATVALAQMQRGYKVLVVANRTEFLKNVGELIGEQAVCITGEITDYEERERLLELVKDGKKDAISGSVQIFSEGISVNALSCLIIAYPMSNPITLEQLIGRVQRMHDDKLEPVVVDLQFMGPDGRKHNKARMEFYQRKGWEVKQL